MVCNEYSSCRFELFVCLHAAGRRVLGFLDNPGLSYGLGSRVSHKGSCSYSLGKGSDCRNSWNLNCPGSLQDTG